MSISEVFSDRHVLQFMFGAQGGKKHSRHLGCPPAGCVSLQEGTPIIRVAFKESAKGMPGVDETGIGSTSVTHHHRER